MGGGNCWGGNTPGSTFAPGNGTTPLFLIYPQCPQPEANYNQVSSLNTRLRAIATGENAVFVDLYQALVGNITLYIGVDGLHPTEVGYQRIAETFFSSIQVNLENR